MKFLDKRVPPGYFLKNAEKEGRKGLGKNIVKPRRNEIYMAKLPVNGTSVQRGRRPVLIVQNDVGNRYSSTTIIIPMTGRTKKALPTHVRIGTDSGLSRCSTLLCEQMMTIGIELLQGKIGEVTDPETLEKIDRAIRCSLAL